MENKFDPFRDGDLNREDSGAEKTTERTSESAPSPFTRDKRPRIRRVTETLNERKPRESTGSEPDERRPFDPSRADRPRPFRPEGERPAYPPRDPDSRPVYRNNERGERYERPDRPADAERDEAPRRRSYNPNFDENNRRIAPRGEHFERNAEEDNRFNSYRYDREQPPHEGNAQRPRPAYRRDEGAPRYGRDERPSYPSRYGEGRDNRDNRGYRDNRDGRESRPYTPGGNRPAAGPRPGGPNRPPRPGQKKDPFKTPKGGYDSNYKPKMYPAYAAARIDEPIRLNKYISMSGLCSRREADDFIQAGEITVNGQPVTELGVKINPGDEIRHKGELLQGEKRIYILMNKPKGFVTTLEDPNAERTVMDIVKNACQERVYPVGRLDKNSLGVLLITNDGELTKRLTHPSNVKKKVYQVALDRPATAEDLEKLYRGVELEDGEAKVDEVEFLDEKRREVGLSIHSGRNRIVRRMFEALGYHVQKLDRVYFAGMTKKGLRRGAWRYLTPKEVAMLKAGTYE